MSNYQLDKEEQELALSIEKGEWKPVKNMAAEIKKYAEYAKNALKKDQRMAMNRKPTLLSVERSIRSQVMYEMPFTRSVRYVLLPMIYRESRSKCFVSVHS